MNTRKRLIVVLLLAVVVSACASPATPAPAPTSPPTRAAASEPSKAVASEPTKAANSMPFAHTACANGVDLTGQTINFYHLLNVTDQVDWFADPMRAGYADAAEYFNAHDGICGATVKPVFDEKDWGDAQAVYNVYRALSPKPVVVTLYGSGDAVQLADQLAKDEIPAVNVRGGSIASAYGEDGQTPGWAFATNPLYVDQAGALCAYIAAHPDRYPKPVIGFLNFDDGWAQAATDEVRAYCTSLGIGDAGVATFSGDATDVLPEVKQLIDKGANILYTTSQENGPAVIASTLAHMGLRDKVTLAAVNRAMDTYVAALGEANRGADGLPLLDGMLGSLPIRSYAETDNPGIQLINAQADSHQRPLTMRTDGYIMGWKTTDLLIEAYIQTGNRVGFDHVIGAEFKKTLENLIYAPLGGVEQIDYQGGKRRALAANRIGVMHYLGQDGKTPAGPGNPPKVVAADGKQGLVPMIVPLTDFQPAPDLRPGGADVHKGPVPTATPMALGKVNGRIVFQSDRSGDNEIYVMNGDGSGLTNLTNNPETDMGPVWSPDGKKILFLTDRDGNWEIYVMNADGSNPTNLTKNPANDGDSASPEAMDWSPDGKKIVFQTNRDGNNEIYVMNADGSAQTNLTKSPGNEIFPKYSADGKHIGFTTDRAGNDEIFLMNADGSNPTRLTNNPADDAFPRWSPDGKKIVYVNGRGDGRYEIFVMNADGSNPAQLTNSPGGKDDNMGARWSPDGKQIIFWSSRDGNQELYVMNADGSNQTRLTDNPANDANPMLQP